MSQKPLFNTLITFIALLFVLCACEVPKEIQEALTPPRVTTIDDVTMAALKSPCLEHRFKERGKQPKAYATGMALLYAKQLCEAGRSDLAVVTKPLGSSSSDAMALYGREPTLRNVWGLMIGSGMRESSGKHCEGRDLSAGNTDSQTAEAGMFQTSYNSRSASAELPKLMAKYRSSDKGCFLEEFRTSGCTASDAKTYGTGDGAVFQVRQKACPAFAAEWHAVMLRVRMNHYGPIKRKESEIVPACLDMLAQVESLITPALCEEIASK